MRKFILLILFSSLLYTNEIYSQEGVVVTGGLLTGTGGESSYSVGQVAYVEVSGTDKFILQGIQQPFEISTLGIDEFNEINLRMVVYPNPAIDVLSLAVNIDQINGLSCKLFDITGKLVSKNIKINTSETKISMQELSHGVYFLIVNKEGNSIKTFKIIKK